MLSKTGDVREMQEWFRYTHEVQGIGMAGVVWRLRHLPAAGSIGEQDAWTMQALEHCGRVANALLFQQRKKDDEQELHEYHEHHNKRPVN